MSELEEEVGVIRQALRPYQHRLGVTGLVPDELARVLAGTVVPVIRRRVSQELGAGVLERLGALSEELRTARGALTAAEGQLSSQRAQIAESADWARHLEGELATARATSIRYREALARAARGESWAAREALR